MSAIAQALLMVGQSAGADFDLDDVYYAASMRHSTPVTMTGSLADLSAHSARLAANYNAVAYETAIAKFGACRLFSAANQAIANEAIAIPEAYILTTGVARTYDCWFRATSLSTIKNNFLFTIRDTAYGFNSAGQMALALFIGTTGKLHFYITDSVQLVGSSGGGWSPALDSTTTVTTGAFHHARVTVSATGSVKMYLNGALEASGTMPVSPPARGTRAYLVIGDSGNLSVAPFSGRIEGVAILAGDIAPSALPSNIYNEAFREKWDTFSNATISNSDRTITQTTNTIEVRGIGRGRIPRTGKWYAEMNLSDSVTLLAAGGIVTASNKFAAARSNASSAFVSAGITAATQASFSGGRLMLALDWPNKQMWVGRDGTWFASGDPAAGSAPYFSTLPEEDWYLFTHHDNDGSGTGISTLHLSSGNLGYSPPSGFSLLA